MRVTGDQAITIEWCMVVLPFILVVIRIYARYYRLRTATKSDAVVVFTFLCFLTGATLDTLCWKKGLYSEDLTYHSDWLAAIGNRDDVIEIKQMMYGAVIVYFMNLWGVKLSVLLIYWPLIPRSLKTYRRVLHGVAIFTGLSFAISIGINMFWCIPISRNWVPEIGPDTCHSYTSPYTYGIAAILHILCDFLIYLLPFPLLRILRIPRRKLYSIASIFALGFLVVLAGIVRVVAIGTTVNIPQVGVWSTVEQAVGIIVVCVPALRTAIIHRREMLGRRQGSTEDLDSSRQPQTDLGSNSKAGRALRWFKGKSKSIPCSAANCSECQSCAGSQPGGPKGKHTMTSTCLSTTNKSNNNEGTFQGVESDEAVAAVEYIMMEEGLPDGRRRTFERGLLNERNDEDHKGDNEHDKDHDHEPDDLEITAMPSHGNTSQENLTRKWETGEPVVVKIPPQTFKGPP